MRLHATSDQLVEYKKKLQFPGFPNARTDPQGQGEYTPVSAPCPPRISIICLFSASYILALAAAEAEKGSNLAEVAEARFEDISVLEEALFSLLSVEAAAAADLTAAARFSALTEIWSTFPFFSRVLKHKCTVSYKHARVI